MGSQTVRRPGGKSGKCVGKTLRGLYTYSATGVDDVNGPPLPGAVAKSISGSIFFDGNGKALTSGTGVPHEGDQAGQLQAFNLWQTIKIEKNCTAIMTGNVIEITKPIQGVFPSTNTKFALTFGPSGDTFVYTEYSLDKTRGTVMSGQALRICNPAFEKCPATYRNKIDDPPTPGTSEYRGFV